MAESRNSGTELEDKSCQTLKYKGVRKRKWGKWVSEIRLPNSRERIWLGSYDKPEKAARAFDAAQFCLRGHRANFNFPDTLPDIPGGHRFSAQEIQAAAAKYASEYGEDRKTELRDSDSNSMAGEHDSDLRNVGAHVDSSDGAVVWPVLDMFDGGLDLDIYSGFYSIMAVNEQLYDRGILFRPVRDDMEDDEFIDGGEYFSHQPNFLWNFDNH